MGIEQGAKSIMQVTERVGQIRKRCNEVIANIQQIYGIDCSDVQIRFDVHGRVAGYAGWKRSGFGGPITYFVRFNIDMIGNNSFNHIINDTVPHEFAHIACYKRSELGRNHDQGWKRVCLALGGTATRCHSEEVVYAKGRTFQYETTSGVITTVSEKIHRKIQMGSVYRMKRSGGQLNKACRWALFGQPLEGVIAETTSTPVTPPAARAKTEATKPTVTGGASKATLVRERIKAAKQNNKSQAFVIALCIETLGMTKSLATTYVKNNWDKA